MTAHTPGPWIAESSGEWAPGYWQVHTATGKPRLIAQKLDEQDARLIAAAPRMLEWLKDYVSRASDINPLKRSALDILKEIELCGEKSDGH